MPSEKNSSIPLVSVVIVNWNGLDDTKLCLEHTRGQTYKNIELIVVDNGSQDGSVDYLRQQDDIKLVENHKNLGFTGGHIAGYKASTGKYILLLNNDAIMDKQYIELAVCAMTADQEIGALGGRAYLWDDDNDLFDTTNSFYAYQNVNPITAEGIFTKHDLGVQQSVNVVSGSCVMIRRKITEEVGYLHDPFFAYFEESDLFARMKRAGFKVIYNPKLAIWHANAKSTNKKPPTFFYYMIMRNRFRFAVRNFDRWSLQRFLFFYFKMGIVSIVKSLLPLEQRLMHWAYAKAFFYNLIAGWKILYERRQLRKLHGSSNYNQIIVREQTGISIVSACDTKKTLDSLIEIAKGLEPIDQLMLVTKDASLNNYLESKPGVPQTLRICVDRGYFDTPSENIGAICAKNEWILLANPADRDGLDDAVEYYSNNVYFIKRQSAKFAIFKSINATDSSFEKVLNANYSSIPIIERSVFVDSGGLDPKLSFDSSIREMLAYSFLDKSFLAFSKRITNRKLDQYFGGLNSADLERRLSTELRQSNIEHKRPSLLDKVAKRYYRVAQLRTLLTWLIYWKIPFRLKAGRIKNLIIALVTLSTTKFAAELKHMNNEVSIYKSGLDMVAVKNRENARLSQLSERPQDTTVFIILRDRFEPLKQLLPWLEKQGIKKIVFIDNDSKLPPLVDFLKKTNYQVLELSRNMTQTAPWSAGIIKILLPEDFYVVTDPDIIPTRAKDDVLKYLYEIHERYPHHLKVGLGLKIDDLPNGYPLKKEVIKWESQFWRHELEPGVYEAGVDTTFAVYKPFTYTYVLHPSLRIGEPYTAKHLPWYDTGSKISDEETFYRMRADQSVNSWNKSHLPERYKKELAKQGH